MLRSACTTNDSRNVAIQSWVKVATKTASHWWMLHAMHVYQQSCVTGHEQRQPSQLKRTSERLLPGNGTWTGCGALLPGKRE